MSRATWPETVTPLFDLASSAIRCRFVDKFVRPNVLSRVSRHRFPQLHSASLYDSAVRDRGCPPMRLGRGKCLGLPPSGGRPMRRLSSTAPSNGSRSSAPLVRGPDHAQFWFFLPAISNRNGEGRA